MDSPSEMKRQLEWNSHQERRFVQRHSVIYKDHNQLTHYSLPIYCVPPARALKGHHKYSYQSIRTLHDPYLYSFVDMEHFTSEQKRLSQGCLRPSVLELLSSHRREPSPPSMQAWVQEDNPCRHSETGDLGEGFKKKTK